jgi:hypothetical protein
VNSIRTTTTTTQPQPPSMKSSLSILLAAVLLGVATEVTQAQTTPIIPNAAGFGMTTRGGFRQPAGSTLTDVQINTAPEVLEVTSLEDTDNGDPLVPNTLRWAIKSPRQFNANGRILPRIVVFSVGGFIHLRDALIMETPYLSIMGQTAPEPGINLHYAPVSVTSHDIFIQHLRIRLGDKSGVDRDAFSIFPKPNAPYNIVVDHCSVSWGIDETMSFGLNGYGASKAPHDITYSNCIIAEGLKFSLHEENGNRQNHSMGTLIPSDLYNISLLRNFYAHCSNRHPEFGPRVKIYVRDSVFYNPGDAQIVVYKGTQAELSAPNFAASFINNVSIGGINTKSTSIVFNYVSGNLTFSPNLFTQACGFGTFLGSSTVIPLGEVGVSPPTSSPINISGYVGYNQSLGTLRNRARDRAGARPTQRDAVDLRLIAELTSTATTAAARGEVINSQLDNAGGDPPELDEAGYPVPKVGSTYLWTGGVENYNTTGPNKLPRKDVIVGADTVSIPNPFAWFPNYDPAVRLYTSIAGYPSSPQAFAGNGYTNIEIWLHGLSDGLMRNSNPTW